MSEALMTKPPVAIPSEGTTGCEPLDDEALKRRARQTMPSKAQRRLKHLLRKDGEGRLTPREREELEALMSEYHRLSLEKAEALYLLKGRGEALSPHPLE